MSTSLNRRLTLESAERTPDGAGGFVEAWQALGTLWAHVEPRTGRLAGGGTGEVSVMRYRITVRGAPMGHSNRPKPGQRFVAQGRVFNIEAVSEDKARGLYLVCHCEEEVSP
ncbi:phage head closure protein [Pacificoceanicola onchidii]|uniref:phage head closure protein n=1 Tax=Pacificoceanicola onchidii TaxID=2562685 RepID=UPI0010A674E3|nr:phage head closure protein [Pacificoceanicola onchidii]